MRMKSHECKRAVRNKMLKDAGLDCRCCQIEIVSNCNIW